MEGIKIQIKIGYLNIFSIFIALTIIGFEFISFFSELIGGESRLLTIPYRALYLTLLIAVLVRRKFNLRTRISFSFVPVLIFWILYILKSLSDLVFHFGEVQPVAGEFFLFSIGLCFLPMFPMLVEASVDDIRQAKLITLILTVVANVWGFKNNFLSVQDDHLGRFLGNELLNQISYGQTGVMLILISLTMMSGAGLMKKGIFIAFVTLGLVNIALAASRGPMIQLVCCLLAYVFLNARKIGKLNLSMIVLLGVTMGVYFADKLILFTTLIDRLSETGFNTGDGNAERYYLIKDGWQSFLDNPFWGYTAIGIYPHNLILESLMALGFVGGVTMAVILVISFIESVKAIKSKEISWLGLILFMQVIGTFTSGSIVNSLLLWAMISLVFSLNQRNVKYG